MSRYNSSQFENESMGIKLDVSDVNTLVFQRTLIPSFVYIFVLAVIGIPGNALVCYVYKVKIRNKQHSSNIFILALSFFDLLNCLTSLPIELDLLLNFVQFDKPALCAGSRFISFFCNNASSVILLAIAVDRLVAFISGPVRRRLDPYMAKCIVLLAILVSGCLSWPMFIFFGSYKIPLGPELFGFTCSIKQQYVNSTKIKIFTITLLSLHVLFDVLFLVIYSIIGKRICYDSGGGFQSLRDSNNADGFTKNNIRQQLDFVDDKKCKRTRTNMDTEMKIKFKSQGKNESQLLVVDKISSDPEVTIISDDCASISRREENDSNQESAKTSEELMKKQRASPCPSECKIFNRRSSANRTSFMLFLVTMAYVISFLPYCIIVVVRHVSMPSFYIELTDTEKTLYQFFLRSYCLSSAINPIIYSFVNASFRTKCKEIISDLHVFFRLK